MFEPLDKMRYSEQIAHQIQKRILEDDLKSGDRLPSEKDMADKFHVSRTVIREAMRVVENLGLVTIRKGPGGGIFVTQGYHKPISDALKGLVAFGHVTVENIFELRFLIGPYVAQEAAKRAKARDVAELKKILETSEQNKNDALFLRTNRGNFHLRMTKAIGNPVLEMVMKSIVELLRRYFHEFKNLDFERWALTVQWEIVGAIESGRSREARRLMNAYLMKLKGLLEAAHQINEI